MRRVTAITITTWLKGGTLRIITNKKKTDNQANKQANKKQQTTKNTSTMLTATWYFSVVHIVLSTCICRAQDSLRAISPGFSQNSPVSKLVKWTTRVTFGRVYMNSPASPKRYFDPCVFLNVRLKWICSTFNHTLTKQCYSYPQFLSFNLHAYYLHPACLVLMVSLHGNKIRILLLINLWGFFHI